MVEVETPEAQGALQQVAQLECPHLMQPGWACWKQERASKAEQSGGCTAQNLLTLRKERGESASVLGFHQQCQCCNSSKGKDASRDKAKWSSMCSATAGQRQENPYSPVLDTAQPVL